MKHYFETSDLWDEEILGVFEDALQVSPFLTTEQRDLMINLMYSRFYAVPTAVGETTNQPFRYKAPSTEAVYKINQERAALPDLTETLEKAESMLRNVAVLDPTEADEMADTIRSLLIRIK